MKIKKNLRGSDKVSADNQGPWFKQLIKMDERTRLSAAAEVLKLIKEAKPEAYEFIMKFDLELVGFMPNVSYTMKDNREDSLDVTFVHDFSQKTLLYWCKQGGFGVFINPSLKYNHGDLLGFIY